MFHTYFGDMKHNYSTINSIQGHLWSIQAIPRPFQGQTCKKLKHNDWFDNCFSEFPSISCTYTFIMHADINIYIFRLVLRLSRSCNGCIKVIFQGQMLEKYVFKLKNGCFLVTKRLQLDLWNIISP